MAEKETKKVEAKTAASKKPVSSKKGTKKRAIKFIKKGVAHINATYNNTIISVSDVNGNVIAWSSAGKNGFKGPKKATPFAASTIVEDVCNKVKSFGLEEVNVFIKGVGLGRDAAIRAFNANGINVTSIKDITPVPHNGCRKPKPRRV